MYFMYLPNIMKKKFQNNIYIIFFLDIIYMYSIQGDYTNEIKINTSHSLFNNYPARKNNNICYNTLQHNLHGNMSGSYYPKEYLENEDKKILCKYIKENNLKIYHPVCEYLNQSS